MFSRPSRDHDAANQKHNGNDRSSGIESLALLTFHHFVPAVVRFCDRPQRISPTVN
jgi:hypothetical protein